MSQVESGWVKLSQAESSFFLKEQVQIWLVGWVVNSGKVLVIAQMIHYFILTPAFVLNFFHEVLYNVACGFCSSKKEFFPTMRLIAKKIWSIFHAAIIIKVNSGKRFFLNSRIQVCVFFPWSKNCKLILVLLGSA